VPTAGFVPIGTAGTSNVDADGDLSTCWDLGTVATRTLAFARSGQSWADVTLKVLSSVDVADGSSQSGTVTVSYSLDGGNTFSALWSATGKQARAAATDAVTLPANQDLGLVQVRFDSTMPPLHFRGCEVWLDASH